MWQTRFRLVCHFVCHFYPKWQTKRIQSPLGLSVLSSNFLLGRFLFFGKFAKVDFAGNHVRGFHLAVHVDVGVNIGCGGKAGMPQPHLHLFHCDFVLDKQAGAGVAEVVIANRAETVLQEHFAENPCHIVRGHKIPAP